MRTSNGISANFESRLLLKEPCFTSQFRFPVGLVHSKLLYMTIPSRARTYRACWILALLFAAIGVIAFVRMGSDVRTAVQRLPGFASDAKTSFPSGLVSLVAAALCAAYGIIVLFLLSFRYSHTVSMELFFFAFWAFALAAEPLRLESLRGALCGASFLERNVVTRVVLSARLFGNFSLFAGSLYAAGFKSEKQEIVLATVILLALLLGTGLPINTGSFGPDLLQRVGYGSLNDFLTAACFLGVCANYLLAIRITGEGGYRVAALGCALAFAGGLALRGSASIAAVLFGSVLLVVGTVLFLRKIHSYYLWQ
jgi:hypothetical protein